MLFACLFGGRLFPLRAEVLRPVDGLRARELGEGGKTSEQADEQADERTNEWTNKQTNKQKQTNNKAISEQQITFKKGKQTNKNNKWITNNIKQTQNNKQTTKKE